MNKEKMDYKLKLEAIKTVKELFDFRDELLFDVERYSSVNNKNYENLEKCQNANFFLERVSTQIKYIEREGLFLSVIEVPQKEVKERTFTENEISILQSDVHKITGDGEVMELFNQLLGVSDGSGSR